MNGSDLAFAALFLVVPAVFLVWRYRSFWSEELSEPADRHKIGSFHKFVASTPSLTDAEPALFLVDRVSKLYDEILDATKSQEAKATTILGFVGGGASLIALSFGSSASAHPAVTALLMLSLAYFLATLLACLLSLVPRERRGLPELNEEFAKVRVLNDGDTTKARVAAYLFLALEQRVNDFRRINVAKSYFIELAQLLFAFGVITVLANYLVSAQVPAPAVKPTTLHCKSSGTTWTNSNTLDCTTGDGGLK